MTKVTTTITDKTLTFASAALQVFLCAGALLAQQAPTPRGVPPPLPNTPGTERNWERINSPKARSGDLRAPNGRATLGEIKRDFLQLQVINNDLLQSVTANHFLDYKYISEAAEKMQNLAGRLDSNFALGKSEHQSPAAYEFNDADLRASLFSLHDLVRSFVHNPVFQQRGVFDIQETKRAKQDVDGIIATSKQIKRIAKRLGKDENRQTTARQLSR